VAAAGVAERADEVPARPRRSLFPAEFRRVARERLGITADEIDGSHCHSAAPENTMEAYRLAVSDAP
jgi:hypothetical protein